MQTLRKRTSPCKYKNDPSRFLGEGITFKAKLIGILEVSEARGDKMCQDALNDLKIAIRAAGEHKQRITISISIDGLRLRDEKTGDCLYHHPVHKISFIAQDMSDSRAFGYIFGSPDTGHRFFGIKTDKTASQVVISMRDLFQVVFELKKKEIEMAKHHSEQHQLKYTSSGYMDSIHFSKDDGDADKAKGKYSQLLKSRCLTSKPGDASTSEYKGPTSEAIADLLDLEHELNSIQQGITQMEKITPPDPFGPLSKADPYIDPFDDSFSPKGDKPPEDNVKTHPPPSHHTDDPPDRDNHSSLFGAPLPSAKPVFFPQFSPGTTKPKTDDAKWFDQETESLFNDAANASTAEPTSSPVALNNAVVEAEQFQPEGKKSPVKTDLFTELDPLGTGRVKPYVDKKDFFQELKNPPKKLLKELITETTNSESPSYFPANFKEDKTPKTPPTAKSDSAHSSGTIDSAQGFTPTPRYSKIDPFEDSDPFDKTDPFHEETFPSLFPSKPSIDNIFDDKPSWKFDVKDDPTRSDFSLFSSATLRVSLPPENIDPTSSTFKSPPDSPEHPKSIRRKNYHALKQTTVDASEDSPVHEEPFVTTKVTNYPHKSEGDKRTLCKDKYYSIQSPPSARNEKSKMYSSLEVSDVTTPDPPPRAKTSLFFIKPPPLPPKKTTHSTTKPPARPPSLEDHYDYLDKNESPPSKEELKCVKLKKHIFAAKNSPPTGEIKKHTSDSTFPMLPPPPNRKPDSSKLNSARKPDKPSATPGSILNLKLNQLDNTGLENLAITLGIPSENIYSMTLQELTKMLAEKYLIAEAKADHPSDSFEVDFDANFAKLDASDPKSAPSSTSYDKYAVFKELMENETKATAVQSSGAAVVTAAAEVSAGGQEEDRYAALRQLSLSVDKCENASEDEEGGSKAGGISPAPEDFSCAMNKLDLVAGMASSEWSEGKADVGDMSGEMEAADREGPSCLFPLVDEFSGEKPSGKDNWATFDKSDFGNTPTKKAAGAFENENSPVSSDGKEDVREMEFHWQETGFRKRTRKDVPWQDDDESWDDYSPKESFCSDESSHEERSPDPRRSDRYEKDGWEVCGRGERKWNGKNSQWGQREKWTEETEDEFEESWRKQKERTSSYELERKGGFWHNSFGKHHDWCNSRSEPWDENDRHVHCYVNMRKRSESDNEYRKRCDSDASEKECVWTFQKNYADSLARSGKQKQYYGTGHAFRDCPEHCHESRAKHRKGVPQKRPSSASESKRSYEKMCSPGEYPCRGPDKPYPSKPDKDDYFRYQCSRKNFRHRGDTDFPHYHADKRAPQHPKASARTSRGANSIQTDLYPSPSKRNDPIETQSPHFDYFEPFRENKHRNFHFDGEAVNFEKGRKGDQFAQEFSKGAETRANQWASANGKTHGDGCYSGRGGETFAKFPEESKPSPRKSKDDGKAETGAETGRAVEGRGKGQLGAVHRQESSATLRKSDSINIFSRDKDPFEGDDFFSSVS